MLPEARGLRSGQMARRFGITAEEMMSLLYVEMIGGGKIGLYRDDGGSLWGWMRTYVRGYIHQADPAKKREISLEGADSATIPTEGRASRTKFRKWCQIRAAGTPHHLKTLRCDGRKNGNSCRNASGTCGRRIQ